MVVPFHYKNMALQNINFSEAVKIEKILLNNFDIFLDFTHSIVGTHEEALTSTHHLCF